MNNGGTNSSSTKKIGISVYNNNVANTNDLNCFTEKKLILKQSKFTADFSNT